MQQYLSLKKEVTRFTVVHIGILKGSGLAHISTWLQKPIMPRTKSDQTKHYVRCVLLCGQHQKVSQRVWLLYSQLPGRVKASNNLSSRLFHPLLKQYYGVVYEKSCKLKWSFGSHNMRKIYGGGYLSDQQVSGGGDDRRGRKSIHLDANRVRPSRLARDEPVWRQRKSGSWVETRALQVTTWTSIGSYHGPTVTLSKEEDVLTFQRFWKSRACQKLKS